MKQTAVEWLLTYLPQIDYGSDPYYKDIIEQAKEMFEKQVRDAWNDGRYENTGCGDSEAYYDETFNE